MDFLLLCLEKGVAPERIHLFLLGLGMDPNTVALWLERAVKETQNRPIRNKLPPVPSGLVLEGKTGTDFVLPEIDGTINGVLQVPGIEDEESVSLELEPKTDHEDSDEEEASRVDLDIPVGSMIVNSSGNDQSPKPPPPRRHSSSRSSAKRVELEKKHKKKKKHHHRVRDLLRTPQAKLSLFSAVVLVTWIMVDTGSMSNNLAAKRAAESLRDTEVVLKSDSLKELETDMTGPTPPPAAQPQAGGLRPPAEQPTTVYLAPGAGTTVAPAPAQPVEQKPPSESLWTRAPSSKSKAKTAKRKKHVYYNR
jgi:hypothetical protein